MTRSIKTLSAQILAVLQVCVSASASTALESFDRTRLDSRSSTRLDANDGKAQALADEGRASYSKGNYTRAVVEFTKLLQLKPADALAFYNRGNSYYQMNDLDKALSDFNESLKIMPNNYLALMNRGNIFSQLKRYNEAIADYDKALALNPSEFLIYFNRGIAFGRRGSLTKALDDLTKAIRLKPDDAMAYASRGDVLFRQHELEQARQDYTKAVGLDASLAHAAERLRTLANGMTKPDLAEQGIDTTRIAAGIAYLQTIARLITLNDQACFQNGDSEEGLRAFAAKQQWADVGAIELKKVSNGTTTMVNGWTFNVEDGSVAVMQSKINDVKDVYVCSMTVKFSGPHTFGDFKAKFEKHFNAAPANLSEQGSGSTIRYWLPHKPSCDVKNSVIYSREDGTITVRMLHGRKADGA